MIMRAGFNTYRSLAVHSDGPKDRGRFHGTDNGTDTGECGAICVVVSFASGFRAGDGFRQPKLGAAGPVDTGSVRRWDRRILHIASRALSLAGYSGSVGLWAWRFQSSQAPGQRIFRDARIADYCRRIHDSAGPQCGSNGPGAKAQDRSGCRFAQGDQG